jgi:hypothetical protein
VSMLQVGIGHETTGRAVESRVFWIMHREKTPFQKSILSSAPAAGSFIGMAPSAPLVGVCGLVGLCSSKLRALQ